MKIRHIPVLAAFLLTALQISAQQAGCPDRLAVNYDPEAVVNDGSCRYNPANIAPLGSLNLDAEIAETSGLIFWDNRFWTHNDNNDINLYALDTLYGKVERPYPLTGISNTDWEEISQDENYIYIGDFGNNSGNRTDLKIYRVAKQSIAGNTLQFDSICFSYPEQVDFDSDSYDSDFDCEAFIVSGDSLYLFTKGWASNTTTLYSVPKSPGTWDAKKGASLNVNGLISGAVYNGDKRVIVLTGYSEKLKPFLYLLYDFSGTAFFGGNKRKIDLLLPYHQVEAITNTKGTRFFITNEAFSYEPLIRNRQKIHLVDLRSFLGDYLGLSVPIPDTLNSFIISPIPADEYILVQSLPELIPADYFLINMSGQIVKTGELESDSSVVNLSDLSSGIYFLRIGTERRHAYKIVKE
ncbi:MAG: T9SS type A sorting domain-containing protein [Bacteroidales bacterium]|jgi:hypothetical protein|nr:T9SS type A sorting domain-containing protein [Bacteroidales bacterium]